MQRNDRCLQLSTYLRYSHSFSSLRRHHHKQTRILPSPTVALCFKYRARHKTSTCVLAEATYHGPCLPAHRIYHSFPRLEMIHSSSSTTPTSHPAVTACRVFDLFGIAHVGVTAQGCAFTSHHGRVCDLFRIVHVRVISQEYASEREIKSFNSFSAQGSESSHMPESSHPCAIKNQS